MVANTTINVTDIDFDIQKADFLNFLSTQDRFKDYAFTGSSLNVLIDLLTYNTQKNAFFVNMGLAEAYIDSAQKRNSIRSQAKELNYVPRSFVSSKANVTVSFTASGTSQPYIVQKGQSFSATIKNQSFIFSIPETITVSSVNNNFTFTSDIYEGIYVKDTYIVNHTSDTNLARYKISNQNVDLSSLTVNVYEDSSSVADIYLETSSLLGLNSRSKVFFVQTSAVDGNYEILFGDGIMGYSPKNGSRVVLDYRIASGPIADGAASFSINFDPTIPSSQAGELLGNISVQTNQSAAGGLLDEDNETTRFYAPRWFQTQERAVVAQDFEVLLKKQFPEITAIHAFSGQLMNPPQYGVIVIALRLSNIQGLPQSKVDQYALFLRRRMMIEEFPVFIQPDFTYIQISSIVRYNINITSETDDRIRTLVAAAVSQYNSQNLDDFDVTFRESQLINVINAADPAIVSNVTDVQVYKTMVPTVGAASSVIMKFNMPLRNDYGPTGTTHSTNIMKTLTSSTFTYKGDIVTLEDDGNGIVRIVKASNNLLSRIINVGTIDYTNGIVQINGLVVDAYDGSGINVYVRPVDEDFTATKNTILTIDPSAVNLTIQQVTS